MTAGYTPVPNWLITNPRMTPATLRVFLVLAMRADHETGECWPTHQTIAADSDCSPDTVQRALTVLREEGAVTWRRGRVGNVYTVVVGQAAPMRQYRTHAAPDTAPVRLQIPHPCGTEQDPENKTQEQLSAADAPDGALMSIEDAGGTPTPVPTGATLYAAWIDAYRTSHGRDPDPAVRGPLLGAVRAVTKTRTDLDSWRHAWRSFRAAGTAGSTYVTRYLLQPSQPATPTAATLPAPPKADLYG